MQQQQILKRQVPQRAICCGQGNEPVDHCGNGQQRLQAALVRCTFHLQRECVAGVGDEGKRVRRVDRKRREYGEDLIEEHLLKERLIFRRDVREPDERDVLRAHLR